MFTRILIPTDFSAPSDAALEFAKTLAGTFGSAVHVLHVAGHETGADPERLRTAGLLRIHARVTTEDLRRFRVPPAVELSDKPADEIVSHARAHAIDLIVMGTHGRTGIAHLAMGSIAEKVVRTAPCPVCTLREAPPASRKAGGTFRILVPTDFSAPSDAALACGRTLASRLGASLHLLHVLEDPFVNGPVGSEVYVAESLDSRTARLQAAQERVTRLITADDRSRLRATTEVIVGASARTIADFAANSGCHLIVMGTHGRTGMAHLVTGSVAEHVLRSAPCPVLTVREARVTQETAYAGRTAVEQGAP